MKQLLQAISAARVSWLVSLLLMGLYAAPAMGADLSALVLSGNWHHTLRHPWVAATTILVHGSALQLLCNVLLLVVAGSWCEHTAGMRPTVALFCLGGVAGSLCFIGITAFADGTAAGQVTLSGASAAIMALTAAALRQSRAGWLLPLLAVAELTGLFGPNPAGALAHLAGLICGVLTTSKRYAYEC